MDNKKQSVTTEWVQIKNKECIKFTFSGTFSKQEAVRASEEWKKLFAANAGKKMVVVFNATHMIDYEPLARSTWQTTISQLKQQIDCIWVISNTRMITTGASLMGLFTSFPIKTTDSEEKIML